MSQSAGVRPARVDEAVVAEFTEDGYLRLPGDFSQQHFPADRCVGIVKAGQYVLMPASVHAPNGLIMKQRNLAGERSTLVREVWGDDHPVGQVLATWQAGSRRLVIDGAPATSEREVPASPACPSSLAETGASL